MLCLKVGCVCLHADVRDWEGQGRGSETASATEHHCAGGKRQHTEWKWGCTYWACRLA